MSGGEDATSLPAGTLLAGKYRVTRLLGRGGMGAVYAAHHSLLDHEVAIKVLLPAVAGDGQAVARFIQEARAAARIHGEHVVRVHDVGRLEDGAPYISMELLDGKDLGELLAERGPLPIAEIADHLLQAIEAIVQAHALGIVHRDLKPANLFLVARPGGERIIKVLDFGISKVTAGVPHAMTQTSSLMGSPLYMSPEQIRNSKAVTAQSDIWALGVIAYELATGVPPFNGESTWGLFEAIITHEPPSPAVARPDLPAGFAALIARCLAKDPAGRFPSVVELAAALEPFAPPDRARRSVERKTPRCRGRRSPRRRALRIIRRVARTSACTRGASPRGRRPTRARREGSRRGSASSPRSS